MVQPAAPPRRSDTANTAATVVLFVLLAGLALLAASCPVSSSWRQTRAAGRPPADTDALFYAYLATGAASR